MEVLLTLLEQHLIRQPLTVVTQATTWWETVLALVKLQESGLGVHQLVKVCMLASNITYSIYSNKQGMLLQLISYLCAYTQTTLIGVNIMGQVRVSNTKQHRLAN